MDQIRVVIAEMANEEKDLLKIRTQRPTKRGQVGAHDPRRTLLSISLLVLCFGSCIESCPSVRRRRRHWQKVKSGSRQLLRVL